MSLSETDLDPDEFVIVTDYLESEEILRNSKDFVAQGGRGAEAEEFVHGTLIDIDGSAHLERRRVLQSLVKPALLRELERDFGQRRLSEEIARVRTGEVDADGFIRFDLVRFARDVFWSLGARLAGIEVPEGAGGVRDLEATVLPAIEAELVRFSKKDHARVREEGRRSFERFFRGIFAESIARRRAEAESPEHDREVSLLSLLLAQGVDDERLLARECLVLIAGTVSNPVAVLCHSFAEWEAWLGSQDEAARPVMTRSLAERVVRETIRLHRTGNPYLLRQAGCDVSLTSGRQVPAGAWVAVDLRQVSRDARIFGPGAGSFDPFRELEHPRAKPYGLGFGTGPHVCLGKALIVDDAGRSDQLRLQGQVFERLLREGVSIDPAHPAVPEAHGGDRYERFPVRLRH